MEQVKILVPISGGKDSQAALKLALQHYQPHEVRGLFCDTQFEHPLTYQHVEWLRQHYGVRIDRVTAGSVEQQCLKHGRFPGGGARFCTEELKIWPTKRYCAALATEQGSRLRNKKHGIEESNAGGFEVWYGMRTAESPERNKRYAGKVCDEVYPPHEVLRKYPKYLAKMGVAFRLCILDWSEQDVVDFVGWENLNPLYRAGFPRVGCFPCLASGDKWKAKAFKHDATGQAQHAKVIAIGAQIGKSVWTSKAGQAAAERLADNDNRDDGPGCMLCAY